ncbi:MAG: hypothetical protein NTY53_24240 [Kiritimatiellaeota bacterium]|nr:hypothetical protein [Kiritimatiellota bacterium]
MIGSIAVTVTLLGGIILPELVPPSNCGGNSAALSACESISMRFLIIAVERSEGAVSIAELTPAERECFLLDAGLNWLGQSTILLTADKVGVGGATGKAVVAVCNKAFDNVPRRMFGKAPFAYAVAYADGTSGLLSVEEFRRLDLSGFVDVRTIQRTHVDPVRHETNRTTAAASR